jgi:metal-responsive CopG/Arc/MetJ family transcriptional regulator
MKTAISVEDDLLVRADDAARKMGISRSRLFSLAMDKYLRHLRNKEIVEQLNRVYADAPDAEERQTLAGIKRHFQSTIRESW